MASRLILITDPDDSYQTGKRMLLVNLDQAQTQLVSDCLTESEIDESLIVYIWQSSHNVEWLLDKLHKSSLVIFNADSNDDIINGFLAAQPNSYYFGTLKTLTSANPDSILSKEQTNDILASYKLTK